MIASEYAGYSTIDGFLSLNMRQLCALLDKIQVRNVTATHHLMNFHAQLAGAEIKPLNEILGVSSETQFDDETDRQLERRASQLLAEKKRVANAAG